MARIQRSVYDIVVAVVSDYDRMKKLLDSGNVTREQAISFAKKISAVDNALLVVCEGEDEDVMEALRCDIGSKRGFSRSVAKAYYDESAFFRRKNEAIRQMARLLNLI